MARPKTGLFARLVLVLALLSPGFLAGEVVPASKQFQIKSPPVPAPYSHGGYDYEAATVTSLGSQGFAVGWEVSFNSIDYGAYYTWGRRLLPDESLAEGFDPTTWVDAEDGWAGELSFASLGEGRFVSVACVSAYDEYEIYFRRFAAGQAPLDEESVYLESYARSESDPHIASNGHGLFVLAWNRFPQYTAWQKVAQVFGPDGQPVSPQIAVTELVSASEWQWQSVAPSGWPVVGMDAGGNFVVLWTEPGTPFSPIWGRRFDRTGKPLGERFRIGSQGTYPGRVAMVMAPSGEFVAAWRAPVKPGVMLLSRFTADGRQTGPLTRLAYTSYHGADPAMALDRSGRVALFWIDERPRPALAVFDASLNQLGPVAFGAPASCSGYSYPKGVGVAFGDDGRILTVWVGRRGTRVRDSILGRFWRVR